MFIRNVGTSRPQHGTHAEPIECDQPYGRCMAADFRHGPRPLRHDGRVNPDASYYVDLREARRGPDPRGLVESGAAGALLL